MALTMLLTTVLLLVTSVMAVGGLLFVLRVGGLIKRSEVLREVRAEEG